jgi:hypothetical protein
MKKTLLMAAALVVLAGCGEKKTEGATGDTTGMMSSDTGMAGGGGMSHDSAAPMSDTTMARDTTKK